MNIGDQVGQRTILDLWHDSKTYRKTAKVRCVCGHEQTIRAANLHHAQRCAQCAKGRPRVHDIVAGTQYGKRTIIREDGYLGPHRAALVRCECGGVDRIAVHQMRNAHTDGCWRCGSGQQRPQITIGERFGKRVVSGVAPDVHGKQAVYMTCDCGDVSVVKYSVASKHTVCKTCAHHNLRERNLARRRFNRDDIIALLDQGLSYKDVAAKLGCTRGYVSEVKRGKKL